MTRVVLSIGSNLGDRMARLQAAVDSVGEVFAVSRVYQTDPWGGVDQEPFLNAVLIADDPACDGQGWLRRAQAVEQAQGRVRGQHWGPRTLDVDLITCYRTGRDTSEEQVTAHDSNLMLPHPLAHQRAFVLIPWLDVDPDAELAVDGRIEPVAKLLAELDPAEREGVRLFGQALNPRPAS